MGREREVRRRRVERVGMPMMEFLIVKAGLCFVFGRVCGEEGWGVTTRVTDNTARVVTKVKDVNAHSTDKQSLSTHTRSGRGEENVQRKSKVRKATTKEEEEARRLYFVVLFFTTYSTCASTVLAWPCETPHLGSPFSYKHHSGAQTVTG